MTYAGTTSRSSSRVLILLVVIAIAVVALWAATGGLDEIQVTRAETAIVSE